MVHSQKGNEFFDLDYQNTTIDFSSLPLEFIIEKPVQFVSLLIIFLRGKHMGTSFTHLSEILGRAGRSLKRLTILACGTLQMVSSLT